MKKLVKNPLGLAALVLILVAVLLPAAAYLGYRSNLDNLDRMFFSKGSALMESVLHDAENALIAHREITAELSSRLADNARFALLLARQGRLDRETLARIARDGALTRLDLYSPSGGLLASSDPARAPGVISPELDQAYPVEGVVSAFIIETIDEDSADGSQTRELFAVGVEGVDSTFGVACILADELIALERRLGIGLILDDLSAVEGVAYAVLQDTLGIIAASHQVSSIESIVDDPFFPIPSGEIRAHYKDYSGEEVYELAANFQLGGEDYGFIRVGLTTGEIRSIAEGDKRRFVLGVVVLMVLFAVVAALYFAGRRQLKLEQEHSRIKSLSESVLQGMTEAVIVIDHQDRVILFNKACKKLCGCSEATITGRPLRALNPQLAEQISRRRGNEVKVWETGISTQREGGDIPVIISAVPLLIGGRRYSTVILRDITDRKEAEKLTLRNQKFKTMAELSAGVAHEIRNPLNSIGMNVQRLKLEFTPSENEKVEYEDFIDRVLAEVSRINGIVEQFLTLSRFPGPSLVKGEIHLLLDQTAIFLEPEIAASGIKFVKNIAHAPLFPFDPDQIRQVVANLIGNAVEAMGNEGTLTLSGRIEDRGYRITVGDTGPGLGRKARERIFEPFYSTKKKGLGLGLAIVWRIVNEHEGTIRVESEKGRGSSFIVDLPMKK